MSIFARNGLKILEHLVLGKYAELDFIAGDVEECGIGMEEVTKNWVRERAETRTGDVYKGEGYWEEANSDLHCRRSTVSLLIK